MNSKSQSATELLIIAGMVLGILVIFLIYSQQSLGSSEAAVENEKAVIFIEDLCEAAQLVHSQGEGATTTIYVVIPEGTKAITFPQETSVLLYMDSGNIIKRNADVPINGDIIPVSGPQYITIRALGDEVYLETTNKYSYEYPEPLEVPCSEAYGIFGNCSAGNCDGSLKCMETSPGKCECTVACDSAFPNCGSGYCPGGSTCEVVTDQSGQPVSCECRAPCEDVYSVLGDCSKGIGCSADTVCMPPEGWVGGSYDKCECRTPTCGDDVLEWWGNCSAVCDDPNPMDDAQVLCWAHYDGAPGEITSCTCETQVPCNQAWLLFAGGLPSPAAACQMGYCIIPGEFCLYQNFPIEGCYCNP